MAKATQATPKAEPKPKPKAKAKAENPKIVTVGNIKKYTR